LGAIAGAQYALNKCKKTHYGVTIMKIEGLTTDTNPIIVGFATMDAIWKAIGYKVPEEINNRVRELAIQSWDLSTKGKISFFELFD
jgi:hypothetical protein